MKFGIRTPSINKRVAARFSTKRFIRHSLGFKAPRGYGWITNPRRAAYNRVYNRTTFKADNLIILAVALALGLLWSIIKGLIEVFSNNSVVSSDNNNLITCPRCNSEMVLRNGRRGKFYGCPRFPYCRGTRDYLEGAEKINVSDLK